MWFKKNDWTQIWNDTGIWTDSNNQKIGQCFFMIDFSPSRNQFRIRVEGRNPKEHSRYEVALNTLSKLNLDNINDPARVRDEKLKQLGI